MASFIAVEPTVVVAKSPPSSIRTAYASIDVALDGDLATTIVHQVMVNDLETEAAATFRFPLPSDATVTDFAHYRDGQRVSAAIDGKREARSEFERAVESGEQASLAEQTDGRHFEMALSPIPPRSHRRVELRYTQTLTALAGERRFVLPKQRFTGDVPTLLDIDVSIRSERKVAAIRTPNHPDARVVRHTETQAKVHLSRSRVDLLRDFVVSYAQPAEALELDGRVADAGDRGLFAELRFAFNADAHADLRAQTNVVVVVDHSLSMAGAPLARSAEIADSISRMLAPRDKLGLVSFASEVATVPLGRARGEHLNVVRRAAKALRAHGRSNLDEALSEAARMLAAETTGERLIVVATDGQPTVGDAFVDEEVDGKPVDVGGARVLVAHFNYPSRSAPIASVLPTAEVRFVPNGDAGAEVASEIAKLAAAPMIENLQFELDGVIDGSVAGTLPTRMALGESTRVLARMTGDATISVTGTLHGRPVRREVRLTAGPRAKELGDLVSTEWARVRIAELERQYKGGEHRAKEQIAADIRKLGVQYRLATSLTSFVATARVDETAVAAADYDYDDPAGDDLSPDRIKPGDPEIRIRAAKSAARVFGVLPWGEIIECSWQSDEGLWLGRFLVPRATPDGLYRIRIFVAKPSQRSQADSEPRLRGTLLYRVDSAPPTFDLEASYADGVVTVVATPKNAVFDKSGDSIRLDRVDLKRIVVRVGEGAARREISLRHSSAGTWIGEAPMTLPTGTHQLVLTATDYATNSSQSTAHVTVK